MYSLVIVSLYFDNILRFLIFYTYSKFNMLLVHLHHRKTIYTMTSAVVWFGKKRAAKLAAK